MDYQNNLTRIPKSSVKWFVNLLRSETDVNYGPKLVTQAIEDHVL